MDNNDVYSFSSSKFVCKRFVSPGKMYGLICGNRSNVSSENPIYARAKHLEIDEICITSVFDIVGIWDRNIPNITYRAMGRRVSVCLKLAMRNEAQS